MNIDYPCLKCGHLGSEHHPLACLECERGNFRWHKFIPDNLKYLEEKYNQSIGNV
jgi:hypothetical protein